VQLGRFPFTRKAPLRRGFRLRLLDARHLAQRPRAPAGKRGRVGRPRGEPPLQVQTPPPQWRAVDHYALLLTLSRGPRPRDRGVAASAFFFLPAIHLSAWKRNSAKLVCKMPHSTARWPPYGRPESSRLLKVGHCMLHLHIMMRSVGCVASSQNTDTDTGVGVVRCSRGWSIMRGTACLTSVCIQGDLKASIHVQARRSSRPRSSPRETSEEALKSCATCG
jgi:hypothetical protein